MKCDPNKKTIDSPRIIREMLDRARNVDEAVALMQDYNVDMGGGPPIHYLIADRSGHAVLVEFVDKMIVIPNETPWHLATNHLRATAAEGASGCWRYNKMHERLTAVQGRLTMTNAMDLLQAVSQSNGDSPTQWSVVYAYSTGEVHVVMGRNFDQGHTLRLNLASQ